MRIVEIGENRAHKQEFLQFPIRLYRQDPCWIRPLDKDVENVFDPAVNKRFATGECIRYLLLDEAGATIGRVAAFVNYETANLNNDQPTGGMGFFECIDDEAAATMLFDACKTWQQSKGMEAMDGPINFGERDRWWGLLVDGFDQEPNYCMPYTKPYYVPFFENYGFRDYWKQFTPHMTMLKDKVTLDPAVREKAERIFKNPEYQFKHITKKDQAKYAEDFRLVYNKAWVNHAGVKPMEPDQAQALLQQLRPIMDERLVWFAYHHEEPVGFFVTLPELNQVFKHVNGKLNWRGKLIFLYYKLFQKNNQAFGLVFGVSPEYQGRGIEAAMAMALSWEAWKPGFPYTDLELNWIGDFNPIMLRFAGQLGTKIVKTHITYRKLFDDSKPFTRYAMIGRAKKPKKE